VRQVKNVWLTVGVFLVGCLAGCLILYSSVRDRVVEVEGLIPTGEVEGVLQKADNGGVMGVQLYNGTNDHMVVTGVKDANGELGSFVQLHMAKPVGLGYSAASRTIRLGGKGTDFTYAVLLPGDNAVVKFPVWAECPVIVEYYLVGDDPKPEDFKILVLRLEE
jgi:hypothetical protein